MRKVIVLFIFVCTAPIYSQRNYTSEEASLYGSVFAVIEYRIQYERKFGELVEMPPQKHSVAAYGPDGIIRFKSSFYEDEVVSYYRYYVIEGKVMRIDYWSHGDVFTITLLSYDSVGRLNLEDKYYRDTATLDSRKIYKYDENGRVLDISECGPDGALWKSEYDLGYDMPSKEIFKYDSRGRLKEKRSYRYDGEQLSRTVYEYGNEFEKHHDLDADGNTQSTEIITFRPDGKISHSELMNEDGSLDMRAECIYDDRRNQIQVETMNADGKIIDVDRYEYDARGNWTVERSESLEEHFGVQELETYWHIVREIVYRDEL